MLEPVLVLEVDHRYIISGTACVFMGELRPGAFILAETLVHNDTGSGNIKN